jgi:Uri superfamily endonuclease
MKAQPGTYALILQSCTNVEIQIGRWGQLQLVPGYYIYIGSAFGAGGVQARLLRHRRKSKPKHWHIDYLREFLNPVGAWCSYEAEHLEHRWAQLLLKIGSISTVRGFGCSDCSCYSHLFITSTEPDFAYFASMLGGQVELWSHVHYAISYAALP